MRAAFLHPRFWPTWMGMGILRVLAWLPYAVSCRVGKALGALVYRLPLRFAAVARRNIELCLPEWSVAERESLLRRHFASMGIAVCETALAWYASDDTIRALGRIEGLSELEAAQARGNGVILLAAHFTTLEIGARLLAAERPINVVYRPSRNALLAEFLARCRARQCEGAIPRHDIRSMVTALRNNRIVWFAPDQSYRKKGAMMVPFFGIPAATNPATSRLAKLTGAAVLPYFVERRSDGSGYDVRIGAALEDFPSDDIAADALRVHALIEAQVRRVPDQYLWIHRRFKSFEPGAVDRYAGIR